MTPIEAIVHIAGSTIPCLAVLAFLMLYRRQSIRAELDELRMRQEHGLMLRLAKAKEREARSALLSTCVPLAAEVVDQLAHRFMTAPKASIRNLDDAVLIDELERRFAENEVREPKPGATTRAD